MCGDSIMYHFYLQAVMECNRLVLKQFFGMRWLVGGVDRGIALCTAASSLPCFLQFHAGTVGKRNWRWSIYTATSGYTFSQITQ